MKKYLIEIVLSSIYLRRVEVADSYGPLQEDALVPVRFQRRGHLSAFPGIEADNAAPRTVSRKSLIAFASVVLPFPKPP